MKRLRLYILLFFTLVSIPLTFLVWRSYSGIEQEEMDQLRFFSQTLFDQMESELAGLVQQEEERSVDEYQHFMAPTVDGTPAEGELSPLAEFVPSEYILGYLQNNPDGSFQTPSVADMGKIPSEKTELITQLRRANSIFNSKKLKIAQQIQPSPPKTQKKDIVAKKAAFSERFLSKSKKLEGKAYLGKKRQRIEEITLQQAQNIASEEEIPLEAASAPSSADQVSSGQVSTDQVEGVLAEVDAEKREKSIVKGSARSVLGGSDDMVAPEPMLDKESVQRFQAEVAPFQSVALEDDLIYIFRRIAINNQIYRQGFIVQIQPLLRHLISLHFEGQPLATFASLKMQRRGLAGETEEAVAGALVVRNRFTDERVFPPPFDFLYGSLQADDIPSSPARNSLNVALAILGGVMSIGLLAIYQSAKAIVQLSERRSQFVSSVTHELKTPLTNIRMYVEMLEHGVAPTREREQEYLSILGSESTRLSGLINNVLDLARLEKKKQSFNLQQGKLCEVLTELETVMSEKLKQDGFSLEIRHDEDIEFYHDRDVLMQILMNLIENSVKFGSSSEVKKIEISAQEQKKHVCISVSDSGPGIPKNALKRIFDDFYRVDNDLCRTTGGTGIGLALVKRFVLAMGGSVKAANNPDGGCSISIHLPKEGPGVE